MAVGPMGQWDVQNVQIVVFGHVRTSTLYMSYTREEPRQISDQGGFHSRLSLQTTASDRVKCTPKAGSETETDMQVESFCYLNATQ